MAVVSAIINLQVAGQGFTLRARRQTRRDEPDSAGEDVFRGLPEMRSNGNNANTMIGCVSGAEEIVIRFRRDGPAEVEFIYPAFQVQDER